MNLILNIHHFDIVSIPRILDNVPLRPIGNYRNGNLEGQY